MSNVVDLDRRRPVPSNHVFEAADDFDPTNNCFLCVFRDEDDMGVYVDICEDVGDQDGFTVKAGHWLNGDQCEQFGKALIAAAQIIREADFKAACEGDD